MSMKPSCQPFFAQLSPFIDGELPASERAELSKHLAACTDCATRVADLRAQSGLVRTGLELLTDDVNFAGFADKVLARVTPQKTSFLEGLRISLSELLTYQRGMMVGALGAAAAVGVVALTFLARPSAPEGYANQKVAVGSVTTDTDAHVAPVVMATETGDSIIWVVDHAHVQSPGAPDASQNQVDSTLPTGQKRVDPPKEGEL